MLKKSVALISAVLLLITNVVCYYVPVQAAVISVDGNPSEWSNVSMYSSSDSNVAKWAIAKDSDYIYFYVQENGGDAWNQPITNTIVSISYGSGSSDIIQFTYNLGGFKDYDYKDIEGVLCAFEASQEANKYEVEFAIPLSFFEEDNFTIEYCGVSVKSSDIVDIATVEEAETTEAVYAGITVDGTFTDWNAIAKTEVDNEAITQVAMVFDGDYIYIYIKETSDGVATWSGECANGNFTIYTDTGRNTVFKLNTDSVEGIEGASVVHSNLQYEIAIPVSQIKQYTETLSFGYYMGEECLIEDVANIQDLDRDTTFKGIVYDGLYGDWDFYPHSLVQYSTPGGQGGDAEAALYIEDTTLFGHVWTTYIHNHNEFSPFYIRINEDDSKKIGFMPVVADENGNITVLSDLKNLARGTYEFYIWDQSAGTDITNINDDNVPIYGKMHVTIGASEDEMEFSIDLEKLAEYFDMDVTDMKMIQAQYIVIGTEWATIAGTSSGPVLGIVICILAVAGVLVFKNRKSKVA